MKNLQKTIKKFLNSIVRERNVFPWHISWKKHGDGLVWKINFHRLRKVMVDTRHPLQGPVVTSSKWRPCAIGKTAVFRLLYALSGPLRCPSKGILEGYNKGFHNLRAKLSQIRVIMENIAFGAVTRTFLSSVRLNLWIDSFITIADAFHRHKPVERVQNEYNPSNRTSVTAISVIRKRALKLITIRF